MKKAMRIIVPILLAALIIGSIGWYLFSYDRDFTRDLLLQQARFHDLHGNSRLSSWFYDLAYNYSGKDANVAIELADQYKADGNFTKAESTLSNAIKQTPTPELYMALSKTYIEQDKLLDAVSMLDNLPDSPIKEQVLKYRPSAPSANYGPGFYTQYIDVALASSSGDLYYSTNGDYPSIATTPYTEPIHLPAGETLIYAISVDENGLCSPLSILGYTVGGVIEPVEFIDPVMESAVRAALEVNETDQLYSNQLWELKEFLVPEGVQTLKDLALMPYLRSLTIHSYNLPDLSYLSGFTKLESLDLSGCRFEPQALEVLANLPALHSLILTDCGLSTIVGLENVQKLTQLDLSGNTVRNLEVLSDMTDLQELNLNHNALTSVEALATLKNLEKLDVSFNSLTSLEPMATCVKLREINANNNQINTVAGLGDLVLLEKLSLDYNQLTDVSGLGTCAALSNLSFSNNKVDDISGLSTLNKLDMLGFSYNNVSALPQWSEDCALRVIDGSYNRLENVDILGKMSQLAYVYLDYNQLTSIDAIADCFHLVQVNVYGNKIEDVTSLTDHDIIVNFDPT